MFASTLVAMLDVVLASLRREVVELVLVALKLTLNNLFIYTRRKGLMFIFQTFWHSQAFYLWSGCNICHFKLCDVQVYTVTFQQIVSGPPYYVAWCVSVPYPVRTLVGVPESHPVVLLNCASSPVSACRKVASGYALH